MARFSIGIDLGTTNCALAYFDQQNPDKGCQILDVPQWQSQGAVIEDRLLPSFAFLPPKGAWRKGQWNLPLHLSSEPVAYVLGHGAKARALAEPGRVVHAAKSWLAVTHRDCEQKILPFGSQEVLGDQRLSPLEASRLYLEHLRAAWQACIAKGELEADFDRQMICITVPASFDEAAQRLTLAAARQAGYPESVSLIEEPLAAFQHYLQQNPTAGLKAEERVLVIDIGGGTTDFSLLKVSADHVQREEVGEHILLGGENIDLAIAQGFEAQLPEGQSVYGEVWAQLVAQARQLKEEILTATEPLDVAEKRHVSLAMQGGRQLFAQSMSAALTLQEIQEIVLEGFFPLCTAETEPNLAAEALYDEGLPYAVDPCFTHHLAGFLKSRAVDAVLFAGGTMKPLLLRQRVLDLITDWQGFAPRELEQQGFHTAIAAGAACRLEQLRVESSYPRSVYIELEGVSGARDYLCLVPKGYDGREPLVLTDTLQAILGQPVRFQLFSSTRDEATFGQTYSYAAHWHRLPALVAQLGPLRKKVALPQAVNLEVCFGASGLLDLRVCGANKADVWQLQFQTTALAPAEAQGGVDGLTAHEASGFAEAVDYLKGLYGKSAGSVSPSKPVERLESILGASRDIWPLKVLRQLWGPLELGITRRGRSRGHEFGFLQLAGLLLRPGFGDEADGFRMDQLWRVFQLGLAHPRDQGILEQWWLMWRRVAGGLSKDRQEVLFRKIYPAIRAAEQASAEMILLAGSLERVDSQLKLQLGQKLVEQVLTSKSLLDQKIWALARLASRSLLHGGVGHVLPASHVFKWGQDLAALPLEREAGYRRLAMFYAQAGRKVQSKALDLSDEQRQFFLQQLERCKASSGQQAVVATYEPLDYSLHAQELGEALPLGLALIRPI